jgi:hypothetical protein
MLRIMFLRHRYKSSRLFRISTQILIESGWGD